MAEEYFKTRGGVLTLWAGILAGPAAWFAQMETNYALVRQLGFWRNHLPAHIVAVVALVITLFGGLLAWRNWQRIGDDVRSDGGGVVPRARFMAAIGILMSGMFFLVILAQWIPVFIISASQR